MRNVAWWLTGPLAALALGCSSGSQSPLAPSGSPTAERAAPPSPTSQSALGGVLLANDLAQSAVGLYTVSIDSETMAGTVRLKETQRAGSQSEIFNLEIGTFLRADSFVLDSLTLTPTTVDIGYSVTHPFDPPTDPCGSATAANRLDLAVTGRVLWLLAGSDGNTYFPGDGDYEANTTLLLNPDGYFKSEGLVDTTGLDTNTFPYQEIVDEMAGGTGNRVGLSNGGNVHGNYPGTTSWTQANYAAGITGFGIWGQGQTAANTISVDRAALTLGESFSTDVAILVKYEDPRGAGTGPEKRGNRLPCGTNPASGDPRELVYRAPHFALDAAVIANVSEGGGFQDLAATSATVSCTVVDWDANASEHTATNLAGVADTSLVSNGEAGLPVLDVDIPGIDGSEGDGLTPSGSPSGEADDPLTFSGLVDGTPDQGIGTYTGMVRAIDPVDVSPPTDWNLNHFNLEAGGTLLPLTTNFEGAVLQAFPVDVIASCDAPTGTWSLNTTSIGDGGTVDVTVINVTIDPGSTIFSISIDWDDGNGFTTVDTGLAPGPGPFGPYTSPNYSIAQPTRTIGVRAVADNCPVTADLTNSGGDTVTINACSATTVRLNANFETTTGDNAWVAGFGGLSNFDACGTFVWGRCSAPALPAGMGSSGFRWNTGPDNGSTFCTGDFEEDYGSQSDGNVVSPALNLTGTSCAELQFDGFRNDGGATAGHHIFYSTNGGGSWTSLSSQSNAVGQSDPDVIVDADALAGNASVHIRFQFEDESSYGAFGCWTPGLFPIAGWAIDNVIVRAD